MDKKEWQNCDNHSSWNKIGYIWVLKVRYSYSDSVTVVGTVPVKKTHRHVVVRNLMLTSWDWAGNWREEVTEVIFLSPSISELTPCPWKDAYRQRKLVFHPSISLGSCQCLRVYIVHVVNRKTSPAWKCNKTKWKCMCNCNLRGICHPFFLTSSLPGDIEDSRAL